MRTTSQTLLGATKIATETRWKHKPDCERYVKHVEGFLAASGLKDIDLAKITPGWLDLARVQLRKSCNSPSTASRQLASVRSVLNMAGLKFSLPPFHVQQVERRHFTDAELEKVDNWFRANGSDLVKAYYAVLRDTGARGFEELSKVTTEDIDWEGRSLTLRSNKGSRGDSISRTVWLTDISERALSWLVHHHADPIFTNTRAIRFRSYFRKMRDELFGGDPTIVPYSLRHTFAMRLLRAKVELHTIAKVMGHSSIQTTLSYLHTTAEDKADILSALSPTVCTSKTP